MLFFCFFFFNDTATTEIYTLPYTTLFRSRASTRSSPYRRSFPSQGHSRRYQEWISRRAPRLFGRNTLVRWTAGSVRSEEHTSELQSQSNLVCRLLLEKKKKKDRSIRYLNNHIIHLHRSA